VIFVIFVFPVFCFPPLKHFPARAETYGVPGKTKTSSRKPAKTRASSTAEPLKMIVRRGATRRFQDLKEKTAHLQVEVVWDQRGEDRRQKAATSAAERRASDRRGQPPFTWEVADFVVVAPKPQQKRPRKASAK
jgi:hypothetical protein